MTSKFSFLVNRDSSIIDVIKERAAGHDKTNKKIMLLVGGGGMASIYSAGILAGLESLRLTSAFDVIVGVSSGSINSSFFCSGQARSLLDLYREDFINSVHPFKPWKFFDIGAVEASIRNKLSQNTVINSGALLYMVATDADEGKCELFNAKNKNLIRCIMASSTPAVGWNSAVQIGNKHFMDGEISSPLPIKEAYEMFLPTHVLIILNRPFGQTHPSLPAWLKNIGEIFLSIYNPKLRRCYVNWESNYAHSLTCVESLAEKISIGVISPRQAVSELCCDANILNQTYNSALSSTLDMFKKTAY